MRRALAPGLALALALLAAPVAAQGPGGGPVVHADLAYADRDPVRNLLDIHLPEGVETPPVVMVIHGGGFLFGDKSDPMALDILLRAGFAVAAMNYRLSDTATWPAQLDDLHDAFAFLRANGATYGYDAGRIAVLGGSAGGHLAAMAAITLAADPATRLRAAVILFPPVDFAQMDADAAAIGMVPVTGPTAAAGSAESRLIGAPVGENPALAAAASPLTYLAALPGDARLPDILILHGAEDRNIARGQSGRLFAALLNHPGAGRLEYRLLPGGTHGGGDFDRLEPAVAIAAFLQQALRD